MGAVFRLVIQAIGWASAGYVGNDIVEVVKESKETNTPVQDVALLAVSKWKTLPFWINILAVAGAGAIFLVIRMTKSERKKLLK